MAWKAENRVACSSLLEKEPEMYSLIKYNQETVINHVLWKCNEIKFVRSPKLLATIYLNNIILPIPAFCRYYSTRHWEQSYSVKSSFMVLVHLPSHVFPSPLYPGLHVHLYNFKVFWQIASGWQSSIPCAHSSTSMQREMRVTM